MVGLCMDLRHSIPQGFDCLIAQFDAFHVDFCPRLFLRLRRYEKPGSMGTCD